MSEFRRSGRAKWPFVLGGLFVVLLVGAVAIYQNPFWLIDRGVHAYLRTHAVQDRETYVEGSRIHYLEALPKGSGPERPVVLIHGLGARAADWAPLIPQLARHGYHVYALDLLGYGSSAKPADGDFSLPGEERVVLGFMQAMHLQQADVAGWSMGGWLAALLALDHPSQVRRLLLFDSAGLYFDPDFDASLFTPRDPAGLQRLVSRIEPDRPNIRIPGWAMHGMLRRMQASGWIVERSFRSMISGRHVLDFRIRNLHQPVLIVWGTEDKLTPFSQAEQLHDQLPQSVLYGFRGCGHLAAAECVTAIVPPVLTFLDADPPVPASATVLDGRPPRH